ncbi:MAG: N-6 DNA methylase [Clostridiales bacterium]|nr:N-6 DNA methylase [Clostridiales bacterium]
MGYPCSSLHCINESRATDPACGAGHFLTEAVEAINFFAHTDGDNSWVRDHIYGIEKDYRLARVAKISLFMNGAGEGNIIFGDGLENASDKGIENGAFDILVANPPYSVKDFKQHLQLKNNSFALLDRIGQNGGEIETLFVERIAQLLKPQGVAGVILPSSILSNDSASYIGAREQILQNFYIRAIAAFGSKTFGATGTNTVVMFLEKFNEPPKRLDLSSDSADAVFSRDVSADWTDREILDAYIAQIDVDAEAYTAFLRKDYSIEELSANSYFKMYVGAFADSSDAKKLVKTKAYMSKSADEQVAAYTEKFYAYAHSIEKEKLLYFSLVYRQTTVIITAPADNKAQKEFLGYDWSNRKGNEGIQILNPGGKLYDDSDRTAEGTLASAIKTSFNGGKPSFSEAQQAYAKIVHTKDMLDFSRARFNKAIRTNVHRVPSISSKFEMRYIGEILTLEYGKALPEGTRKSGEYPVMGFNGKVGTHDEFLVAGPAIIVGRKGSAGSVIWEDKNCYPIDTAYYVNLLTNDVLKKYVYYMMKQIDLSLLVDKMGVPGLNRNNVYAIKVPVPPIAVQERIVAECEEIDEEYNTTRMSIESYRKKIAELFNKLDVISIRGGTD